MWRTRRSAVSEAVGSLDRGTKYTALEKPVRMVVLLFKGGSAVTTIWDQVWFGMGRGRNSPAEGW